MQTDVPTASGSSKPTRLERELGLWDVYALATGATLSSGFFLLPGLAAAGAGSAMPLSYVLAALIVLPGLFSSVELTTAMPKAGGIYYFLDRSMGPLVGTIGGFGSWIALVLKAAFALIGVGAYLQLFFPQLAFGPVAAALAVLLGIVNWLGAKKSGSAQIMLLIGLFILLLWFCGFGLLEVEVGRLGGVFRPESAGLVSTAGLVIVSYMGLTKVASVAEEVKNPERNLPLGSFLAFGTAVFVYVVGTMVMIGVTGADVLAAADNGHGDLTPVATVARALERAVEIDPQCSLARALLAEVLVDTDLLGFPGPKGNLDRARRDARVAVALDPRCQQARSVMAYVHFASGEHEAAVAEAEAAISLNPNNADRVAGCAFWLGLSGELERAAALIDRMLQYNPHQPGWLRLVSLLLHLDRGDIAGAHGEAERFSCPAIAWDPLLRAATSGLLDRGERGSDALRELETRHPGVARDPEPYVRSYVHADRHVAAILEGLRRAGSG